MSRSFSFTKSAVETSDSKGWRLFLAAIDSQSRSARRNIQKNPAYDGNVCDCRYRFRSRWFSAISETARSWRGRARVCSDLFSLFLSLSPLLFLFVLVFAQTGYPRYFSTWSFVIRNDHFFVLLYPLVFHCPYLLSLFLPDAAAAPPHFHAFDLTTHIPPPT